MSLLFSSSTGAENSGELAAVLGLSESTVRHHWLNFVVLVRRIRPPGMHVYPRPTPDAVGALYAVLDPNCCK